MSSQVGRRGGAGRGLWAEFRDFAFSGNLIQLAVAVVLGVAFKDLIDAIVTGLITPFIAALGGDPDFSALSFTINGSRFRYGLVLDQLMSFVIIALVLFFIVRAAVRVMGKQEAMVRPCDYCHEDVSKAATRCPHCTSELAPQTA